MNGKGNGVVVDCTMLTTNSCNHLHKPNADLMWRNVSLERHQTGHIPLLEKGGMNYKYTEKTSLYVLGVTR